LGITNFELKARFRVSEIQGAIVKKDLEVRSPGSIVWCDPVVRSKAGEGAAIQEPEGIVDCGVVSWLVLYKVSTF